MLLVSGRKTAISKDQVLYHSKEGSVAAASAARAVADALIDVSRADSPAVGTWRPKLAAALATLGASGVASAAAAADRLQWCVRRVLVAVGLSPDCG